MCQCHEAKTINRGSSKNVGASSGRKSENEKHDRQISKQGKQIFSWSYSLTRQIYKS
jgi:hypothetical protein